MANLLHRCQLILNTPIGYEILSAYHCIRLALLRDNPDVIAGACGIGYDQLTIPKNVRVQSSIFKISGEDAQARAVDGTDHSYNREGFGKLRSPGMGKYAAITENQFGKGQAT